MGRPVSQNSYGELLCEVKDQGVKLGEARVRLAVDPEAALAYPG